jgi:hypothetical protein
MKDLKYEVVGEILITPCPYKKKHGVGLDRVMVGSDQCWNCKFFKGLHTLEDKKYVHCNY